MKRRHGINTSHAKHLSQSQQIQSQSQQSPEQQSEQSQVDHLNASEHSVSISHTESSTVHVRNYCI